MQRISVLRALFSPIERRHASDVAPLAEHRLSCLLRRAGSSLTVFARRVAALIFVALTATVAAQTGIPLRGETYQTAVDSTFGETSTQTTSWYCECYGSWTNLRTSLLDSEEFGAPVSVRIDSISVRGDLARSDQYVKEVPTLAPTGLRFGLQRQSKSL